MANANVGLRTGARLDLRVHPATLELTAKMVRLAKTAKEASLDSTKRYKIFHERLAHLAKVDLDPRALTESQESLARQVPQARRAMEAKLANQVRPDQQAQMESPVQMAKQVHLEAKVNPVRLEPKEDLVTRDQLENQAHPAQRDQAAIKAQTESLDQLVHRDRQGLEAKTENRAKMDHRESLVFLERTRSIVRARNEPAAHSLRKRRCRSIWARTSDLLHRISLLVCATATHTVARDSRCQIRFLSKPILLRLIPLE